MKEWEIGITDNRPSTWKRMEPLWGDEKIVATSKDSYHELMAKLCETAIANRREHDGDSGINAHLWKLTIKSYKEMVDPTPEYEKLYMKEMGGDGESSDDESDEDDEDAYRGTFVIRSPQDVPLGIGQDMFDPDDPQVVSSSSKLSDSVFPVGSIMEVEYDYGSTTKLWLKVLSVKSTAVRSLLQYFSLEAKTSEDIEKMKKVPAYSLPKDKQIDRFYPNFSRAFLGFHVPLFRKSDDDQSYLTTSKKNAISSATMGLSSCIRAEHDTTFCSMEDRNGRSDLLFFPGRFEINDLLRTGEMAWEPVDPDFDKEGLCDVRYDSITRWGIPPGDGESYDRVCRIRDKKGKWGPKMLLYQLDEERRECEFKFEKVFPKTYEMLQSGKFRWFQYKKGVLRVIVGRGAGHDHRGFENKQILAAWKYDFESFHELLCAVEASWTWNGSPIDADTVIPMFDVYLGPSNPLPKEAELVASKNETVVVSRCQDKKKLVTALAVSEDPDGKPVLYSGHDDGTLTKWNLQDNKKIWSRQIYPDESEEEEDRFTCSVNVQYTPGVAGLAVRPDPKNKGRRLLYTWTNGEDNDQNKSLKVWSSTDGRLVRVHVCDVGEDDEGGYACPDISTVVFCQLAVKNRWVDSVLVGLHCLCDVLDNDESYTDFDLEESQDYSEGNILPFYEHPTDGIHSMPSWRGHFGMIRAMAVVQDKFLLSYSIRPGHGRADAIILWSLRNPGVPLFRKDLWRETRNVYKQSMTRLDGVCGISVCGKDVLFADEYGRRIAAVKVDDEEKSFKLEGYAQTGPTGEANTEAFHGRMAMSQSFAATANESDSTVWIYQIEGNSEHPKLDRQDANIHDQESEYSPEKWTGKEIAVARVEIPKFGDDAACSKKRKWDGDFVWDSTMSWSSEDSVGFGDGGPITLALRGRNLITGFSNGTIMNTTLPDRFDEEPNSVSANHLASCSALPSDEWRCPTLECEE